MTGYVGSIKKTTLNKDYFRKVLFTYLNFVIPDYFFASEVLRCQIPVKRG